MEKVSCKYPRRKITLGICKRHDGKYLLLRIRKNWKFCPGDWDFVIATSKFVHLSMFINTLRNIVMHTGLEIIVSKVLPILEWVDDESKVLFELHPTIAFVRLDKNLKLSQKFCEYRWVNWNDILKYDRNCYLATVKAHMNRYSEFQLFTS